MSARIVEQLQPRQQNLLFLSWGNLCNTGNVSLRQQLIVRFVKSATVRGELVEPQLSTFAGLRQAQAERLD
ncbi:MAG: hypothetical protein ACOYNF_08240, partial [Rhodoferax sp.]